MHMAARRLLIVMLVLLGISSAIAIAIPEPDRDDPPAEESTTGATGATGEIETTDGDGTGGTTGETGPTGTEDGTDPGPEGVRQVSVALGGREPVRIQAKPGNRLFLTVSSTDASEVEVEGLGLIGFADRFAPATFDLLLPGEPGKYRVRAPGQEPSAVIITQS